MRNIGSLSAAIGGILVLFLHAAPAQAQSRTWVSGVGDDLNPCSRTAPCKTFAGAISKTAIGGEINCLDSGGFGSVTITKSITIKCEGVIGGVLASGTFGINVNDSGSGTPGTAIVTISGLDIEGFGTGTNGIQFSSGAALHVHKTQIRNFRQSGAGGNGILVTGASGAKELYVADSYITDNGSNAVTGGISVAPSGTGSVVVTVNRTQVENNSAGITGSIAAGGTGFVKGLVRDSMVAGSTNNGITASSGGANVTLMVDNVGVMGNGSGLVATGAGAGQLVGRSAVTANGTAVSGAVLSYGTNQLNGNTGGEAFSGAVIPQK